MRITDPRLNQSRAQRQDQVGPPNPNAPLRPTWRTNWLQALFRDAMFYVENQTRSSGRRVAMHQYPKRNLPYAEDMGRSAQRFVVQGYLIGPFYHELKYKLIDALEKDGPGMLRLPMQYRKTDVSVMVQSYSISEARERGGMCGIEMDFVEYGDPAYRQTIATPDTLFASAQATEKAVAGKPTEKTAQEAAPFKQVHDAANAGLAP
jgi:prophage DNA circulation protein